MAETCRLREDEQLTVEKVRSYELALAGIKPEILAAAIRKLAGNSTWFPTAGEIREACQNEARLRVMNEESRRLLSYQTPLASDEAEEREKRKAEFQQMLKDSREALRMDR